MIETRVICDSSAGFVKSRLLYSAHSFNRCSFKDRKTGSVSSSSSDGGRADTGALSAFVVARSSTVEVSAAMSGGCRSISYGRGGGGVDSSIVDCNRQQVDRRWI